MVVERITKIIDDYWAIDILYWALRPTRPNDHIVLIAPRILSASCTPESKDGTAHAIFQMLWTIHVFDEAHLGKGETIIHAASRRLTAGLGSSRYEYRDCSSSGHLRRRQCNAFPAIPRLQPAKAR